MLKDRIKKLRKVLDLTQQEFANRLGISRGNIATYETREGSPGSSVISLICREFNVSEKWLRTGEGEMFVDRSKKEEIAFIVGRILHDDSDFRQKLISVLARMTPEETELLKKMAVELAEEMKNAGP